MKYGIYLIGIPSGPFAMQTNQWVSYYDPDAAGGRGKLSTTPDAAKALRFDTQAAALQFAMQSSTVAPKRADGKPNRPLTAYTFEIEPLTEQKS